MEAGTNDNLRQFVLHFGIQNLLSGGRSSYSENRGCVEAEDIFVLVS